MKKKVTVQTIADQLGISAATVSRALSGYPLTNENTRKEVQKLADKLGYTRPTASGNGGRNGSRKLKKPIAWITPLNNFEFEDPIILEILGGMASRCVELGRQLLHVPTDPSHEMQTYREMIADRSVDGFIIANRLAEGDQRVEFLMEEDIPFVSYGSRSTTDKYAWTYIAFEEAYLAATRHLVEMGHQNIALLNSVASYISTSEREMGYRSALVEAGLPVRSNLIVSGRKTEEFGHMAMQQLLDTIPSPTAVLCSSTMTAKGALFAISERGLEVGRDISVIAYDDNVAGTFYAVPLTTMFAPVRPIGRHIVSLLERRISGEDCSRLNMRVMPELVLRSSTGPAPDAEVAIPYARASDEVKSD